MYVPIMNILFKITNVTTKRHKRLPLKKKYINKNNIIIFFILKILKITN